MHLSGAMSEPGVWRAGLYLASGSQDKKLVVWDVEKKEVLVQKDMEAVPSALAWHSGAKSNTLASIGEDGVINLWDSVIPSHMLAPSAPLDDALPKPAHSTEMSEGRASYSACPLSIYLIYLALTTL